MPALPATPNVRKMGLLFTFANESNKCENTFYVLDTGGEAASDPAAFCNLVFAQAVAHLVPVLSPYVILNGIAYEDVSVVPFGGITVPETPTPGVGGGAGPQLPSSASLAIKKTTSTLGRSGRGRWYWPIGNGDFLLNGNTVVSSIAVGWAAALAAFQAGIEAFSGGPSVGIVSYFSGGALRSAGVFERITSWGASDLNVDSQRRRLIGRGQ